MKMKLKMKSVRHGGGVSKVYPIVAQQIDEITAVSGESTSSMISRLVSKEYDRQIVRSQEKRLDELQKEYDRLYAAYCEAINK